MPKINEDYISVTYGCIRFIDRCQFLSMSLDGLIKTLNGDDFNVLKKDFPDKWQYLNQNIAYPYENFSSVEDYQKPVDDLKKNGFFNKLENKYPCIEEIALNKKIFNYLILKMEKNLQIFMKKVM